MGVTQKDTKKEKTHTVASLTARQFDEFWRSYPSRGRHSNPKKPARAKFDAALTRGVAAADIIHGAENYAIRPAPRRRSRLLSDPYDWLC